MQFNPKNKFAIMPDSSTNFHHKLNNPAPSSGARDDLDHLLSILDENTAHTRSNITPKEVQRIMSRTFSASSWDDDSRPGSRPSSGQTQTQNSRSPDSNAAPKPQPQPQITPTAIAVRPVSFPLTGSGTPTVKTRCARVCLGGSAIARGCKVSAFSQIVCDCLLCVDCNFKIVFVMDKAWTEDAEYMFFRNNMPNLAKLAAKLVPQIGTVAYCCQCRWTNVAQEKQLVQGGGSDPQWICTGH